MCTNPIDSYHYCIIDSGKSQCTNCTRFRNDFCAGYLLTANKARQDRQCAYVPWYTYTHTLVPLPLYPWYPMPTTYIHTCIDTFVLFIYLSYCLCLSYYLYLSYSSLLSCSVSSRSLLTLGKACPWAEAAGLIFLVCVNALFYLIIIQ